MRQLDIYDKRRFDKLSDMLCRDCENHNIGNPNRQTCLNQAVVRRALEKLMGEGDEFAPLLTFEPDGDGSANRCPGMYPSAEYLEFLENAKADERSYSHHVHGVGQIKGMGMIE